MKIRKNDTVLIITGKDKGRKGKVIRSFPKKSKIVVEGINLIKKNAKPKKSGEKGQIVEITAPMNSSNVKIICPKCGKAVRVSYKIGADKKYRICQKCKQEI
jgi:large subunit ribosomal protein L24